MSNLDYIYCDYGAYYAKLKKPTMEWVDAEGNYHAPDNPEMEIAVAQAVANLQKVIPWY